MTDLFLDVGAPGHSFGAAADLFLASDRFRRSRFLVDLMMPPPTGQRGEVRRWFAYRLKLLRRGVGGQAQALVWQPLAVPRLRGMFSYGGVRCSTRFGACAVPATACLAATGGARRWTPT